MNFDMKNQPRCRSWFSLSLFITPPHSFAPHTDARSLLPENGGSLLHRAVDSAGSRSRAGHGRHHVRTEAGITPRHTASAKADRTMSCLLFARGSRSGVPLMAGI